MKQLERPAKETAILKDYRNQLGLIVRYPDSRFLIMKHGLKPDTHKKLRVFTNPLGNERQRGLKAFLGVHTEEKGDSIRDFKPFLSVE